jgi:type II secretory pathway component GspD/PulD (secretin)
MGRKRVWRVTALLAGALTFLVYGAGLAQPQFTVTRATSTTSPAEPARDARTAARSKLLQARAHLGQGNFDMAESLAREVAQMKLNYTADEDSPAKLFQDIEKARKEPRALLQAARAALTRKDFAQAEKYAKLAEKNSSMFSFAPWGDNPGKVLREVEQAKKKTASTTAKPAPKAPVASNTPTPAPSTAQASTARPPAPAPSADIERARALIKQARQAVEARKLDEAKKLVVQVRQLKPNLGWWEDNPDRLESDIKRLEARSKPATPATSAVAAGPGKPANGVPRTREEAKQQLEQGRKLLAAGKLDEAAQAAQRIKSQPAVSWGLFEDSPDRLLVDVNKARAKRDRDESDRLLVEGRKLYQKGDYDAAAKLAYRSQKLHGPYSIWDLGDRPSKLLADVQSAQARSRKTQLPPAVLARKDTNQTTPPAPKGPPSPTPSPNSTGTAVAALPATPPPPPAPANRTTPPNNTGTAVAALPTPPNSTGTAVAALPTPPGPAPLPSRPDVNGPVKLQAQQLVAEAQRFQREGKLLEARQKAVEAQRLGATFGPDEVSPELVYQQVAVEVRQRIDNLVRQAHETVAYGQGDTPTRCRQAEQQLGQARQLASRFGQDVRPIDEKVGEVRRLMQSAAPAPVKSGTSTSVALTSHQGPSQGSVAPAQYQPQNQGQVLLEKARLELRKGETSMARRMCEEAIAGKYGVNGEAEALLRTVDAEEFNQKRLAADRAFDAAEAAYRRRDYTQSSALLGAINIRMLSTERQARLREIGMTPEMRAATGLARASDAQPVGATSQAQRGGSPTRFSSPAGGGLTLTSGTGRATATDKSDDGVLDRYKQRQKILFEQLRAEGLDVQARASEKFRAGQHDVAMDMLQDYVASLSDKQLDPGQLTLLKRPAEARLNQFKVLKAQKDMAEGVKNAHRTGMDRVMAAQRAEDLKRKNVEKLMKDYNALFKEGKYAEAEALAMRAMELDPDNGLATAAVGIAHRQRAVTEFKGIKDNREELNRLGLNDSENEGDPRAITNGLVYSKEGWDRMQKRKVPTSFKTGRRSDREREIERRLSTPTTVNFENTMLKTVIEDLRDMQGINIVPDLPALQEAGVSLESPVTIKLEQVALKSALNLILRQVKLTYVIKDEVLQITTEEHAKGKLVTVTYPVGDLVIPIENFGDVRNNGKPDLAASNVPSLVPPTPVNGQYSLTGGSNVGQPSGGSMSSGNASTGTGGGGMTIKKSAPTNTTEENLIKLISGTIAPRSWSDQGGPGTVDYFPLTMALVINQTPDIQEQIGDLLASLRRLQDQEVAVEVRFITVTEDFFERIGVNFNMSILPHDQQFEPALQQNLFSVDPNLFINQFRPTRFIGGLTPAGTLTPNLAIPITNGSFFQTAPGFGGYLPGAGLQMGLAFLSDIQVFLFIEAVQGDNRSNIMQAPKLTLFNGQTSTINVSDQQNFVTGLQLVSVPGSAGNFAVTTTNLSLGFNVNLTIQAVISADRRFVRLSLAPTINNLSPVVQTFPITFPIFTSIEGNATFQGGPIVFTQFVQQPTITTVSVNTTVAVPDGGTVLMGGLKRLAESRSEFGPPIVSKIPIISRLFKNVGYGRTTESLLIMVTPRIIIQEEEEERQAGFVRPEREAASAGAGVR